MPVVAVLISMKNHSADLVIFLLQFLVVNKVREERSIAFENRHAHRSRQRPPSSLTRRVRTHPQKLELYIVRYVIASWTCQSLLNRYVFRVFLAFRPRSVSF